MLIYIYNHSGKRKLGIARKSFTSRFQQKRKNRGQCNTARYCIGGRRSSLHETTSQRKRRIFLASQPSSNAIAAHNIYNLYTTGLKNYREPARRPRKIGRVSAVGRHWGTKCGGLATRVRPRLLHDDVLLRRGLNQRLRRLLLRRLLLLLGVCEERENKLMYISWDAQCGR